jgi:cyclopropane-fatty-acyl-phospholipid synthase
MEEGAMNAPMGIRSRRQREGGSASKRGGGMLGLFAPAFHAILDRIDAGILAGSITLTQPDGRRRMLGRGGEGPAAEVDLRSWRALIRLATRGSSGWYEAWERGEWSSPDPVQIFAVFSRNRASLAGSGRAHGPALAFKRLKHWTRRNNRSGSRRNIAFHYDLGNDFYQAWLDPGMTYSSALFENAHEPLEAAQHNKLAAMLSRTDTAPGDTILEIGCGWGSFAELAARERRRVHGITLSSEQKAYAEARMSRQGLDGVTLTLTDYRDVKGSYDAVASIEMVEAVGQEYWPAYLKTIARVLKPGGCAAIQLISFDDALFDAYASNVDFIQQYIFPGGLLIAERKFRAIAESVGLAWRDRRGFGLSYAETLAQWRANFDAAIAAGRLPAQFDARFRDLWRYYLMYCEGGFRGGGIDVAQVTLVKER